MGQQAKLLICVLLMFSFTAKSAENNQPPEKWQESMQQLAKALTDSFPFFYSKSEFRNADNSDAILHGLDQLINTTHMLPAKAGQQFIGTEPLIAAIKNSSKAFSDAKSLYKKKKFDQAQTKIHSLIQNCFACHTAHQVGPSYKTTNKEVFGVATPFHRSKVVVFGALREFGGALDWLEDQAKAKEPKLSYLDLSKLHLLISLRGLQDYKRADKFLNKIAQKKIEDKPVLAFADKWKKDIKIWKNGKSIATEGNPEADYIANLQATLQKHQQLSDAERRAELFFELGDLYKNLQLDELNYLSGVYYSACLSAKPNKALKEKCKKAL